ncbi:hypothetical protein BaRGS_00009893 [Batillaria attramentaria]|uniref:Uncharacterized protein n=1 Tax=Batillaria attramentaria TaxID=370345 RepID=A0ABD0LHQ7_9CAEN
MGVGEVFDTVILLTVSPARTSRQPCGQQLKTQIGVFGFVHVCLDPTDASKHLRMAMKRNENRQRPDLSGRRAEWRRMF